MHRDAGQRVFVDVSSVIRWWGTPVGIIRVEYELAMCAAFGSAPSARLETGLCLWDRPSGRFRALNAEWARLVIGWHGAIDAAGLNIAPPRRGLRRLVPSRQPIVMALERLRLTTGSATAARVVDLLQRMILAPRRHRFPLDDAHGRRVACVPVDFAVGEDLVLGPRDVVLFAGNDWYHADPQAIDAAKRRLGFRLAVICYDLIPLRHPEFFPDADVALFRAYWRQVLPLADLVIFNSHRVEADARELAVGLGVQIKASAVAPLGFDPPKSVVTPAVLPAGLVPGRYALFVSTVEPRKGHALLLRVWRRLLAQGIPQRHDFRLVFVGRPGWLVDDILRQITLATTDATLLWLRNIGDDELDSLYRAAAFCLYPSRYEGFGLPLIEAFARGKAVIASTGGAIPETVGDLAPCLDPDDDAAWERILVQWIEQPDIRAGYEARIRTGFAHPNWANAAAGILALASSADGMLGGGRCPPVT